MKENKEKSISDYPSLNERDWFTFAVIAAFFLLVLAGIGGIWIFNAENEVSMVNRARITAPIGAFGVAAVTFITIIWRGIVNSKQASEQKRQNDSADENNLATLYLKGAELILSDSEEENLVGINVLRAVVSANNSKYALPTVDLLVNYIRIKHSEEQDNPAFNLANETLKMAALEKQIASTTKELIFETKGSKEVIRNWHFVYGVKSLYFRGGRIGHSTFTTNKIYADPLFKENESNVTLVDCNVDNQCISWNANTRATACKFHYCQIKCIDISLFSRNEFFFCDFSECLLLPSSPGDWLDPNKPNLPRLFQIPDLRKNKNYIVRSKFPALRHFDNSEVDVIWEKHFNIVDNPSELEGYLPEIFF